MTENPFDAPAPAGGGQFPALRQLAGRLLVIFPKQLETGLPDDFNPGKTKDRLTCNLVFLDGDPITTIERQNKPTVHLDAPIKKGDVMEGVFISNGALIGQVKGRQMVLGRLVQGKTTKGNPPWVLAEQTEDDKALGMRWWTARGKAALEVAQRPLTPPAQPSGAGQPNKLIAAGTFEQESSTSQAADEEEPF